MEVSEYISEMRRALALFRQEAISDASEICERLIRERPERKGAYLLLAQIHSRDGAFTTAVQVLRQGLKETEEGMFLANLAIVQSKMGLHEEAIQSFAKVNFKQVKDEQAHVQYAQSLTACGQINDAVNQYQQSLQLKPGNKQALNNLSNLFQRLGNYAQAEKYLKQLIKRYPAEAIAFTNLGSLYEKSSNITEAKRCYEKSLELDSSLSITYFNLAQLLGTHLKEFSEALRLLEEGIQKADSTYQKGLRFYQIVYRQFVADWSDYENDVADLNEILEAYLSENEKLPFEIVPYTLSHFKVNNDLYREIARRYAQKIEDRVRLKYPTAKYDHSPSEGKIKVGYFSPNMRLHPGGLLVRKLFDHHDTRKFEIHAFSLVSSDDFVSKEIQDTVDYYHDVSELGTMEIANLINRSGIDILVSLAFYNTGMNVEVLALRPAPIQMVLIGSHETSGAPFIDYAFSDESIIDQEIRKNFTEQIITLPCSLLINSELPIDSSVQTTRKDHGLPANAFVFASFNHPRKLDPESVDTWLEILVKVPRSVLWLYDGGSQEVRTSVMDMAKGKGISEQKIIFASPVELEKHWERLRHADLILDSFNYNAHFTGIEALRMGIPMITLKGHNHNSRLGASLIHYSDLPNCIFLTKNDYLQRSIQLATQRKEMESIGKSLQSGSYKLIFDTEMQVKYLEKAYQKAFYRLVKSLPPKDISIGPALRFDSLH